MQEMEGAPRPAGGAAAPVDLDLAFSAAEDLGPELLQAAGPWGDPLGAADTWQSLLSDWLAGLQPELPPELRSEAYSLGLSLVSDAEIAALNADWRGKAGPTDVLAFAAQDEGLEEAPPMPMPAWAADAEGASGGDGAEGLELGDIVISLQTAERQGAEHGHGTQRELLFLASHGLLHLLGWDHPDDASLAAMLARQEALLAAVPAQWSALP